MGDLWMDRWVDGWVSLGIDGLRADGAMAGWEGERALERQKTPMSGRHGFGSRDLPVTCASQQVNSPSHHSLESREAYGAGSQVPTTRNSVTLALSQVLICVPLPSHTLLITAETLRGHLQLPPAPRPPRPERPGLVTAQARPLPASSPALSTPTRLQLTSLLV